MKNKNVTIWIIAGLIILAGIYYFAGTKMTDTPLENSTISTSTDTTSLSPTNTNTGAVKPVVNTPVSTVASGYLKIGQRKLISGVFVTPIHLTLDSRCPTDVKCIQAGTADINTLVQKGNVSQNVILSLNKTVAFSGKQITLTSVTPRKLSTQTIAESDYEFLITVK